MDNGGLAPTLVARPLIVAVMFHIQDGWHVERRLDGSVLLESRSPVRRAIIIDPSAWASIVATVSARGETTESYREALERHMADPNV